MIVGWGSSSFLLVIGFLSMILGSLAEYQHHKLKMLPNSIKGRYIIEFNDAHSSPRGSMAKRSVVQSLRKRFKSSSFVKHDFSHPLLNALSVDFTSIQNDNYHYSALHNIAECEDVKNIYSIQMIQRPRPMNVASVSNPPKTPFDVSGILPHKMTQVDQVHQELGYKGEGVLIGIIDTAVDFNHPALGGGFGPGFKVSHGYDLVGNEYNGNDVKPKIKPSPIPYDSCTVESGSDGHATHVSGIIAGEYPPFNFVGVAPKANLGVWRVFGCNGTTTTDIGIKAMLMAADAGCDVISMSLGGLNGWSTSIFSTVSQRIVDSGIQVIAAVGNDGQLGAFTVSELSIPQNVVGVASVDNAYKLSHVFSTSGSLSETFEFVYVARADHQFPLGEIVVVDSDIEPLECLVDIIPEDIKGKIALVRPGKCSFDETYKHLEQHGAIGMIFLDDSAFSIDHNLPFYNPKTTKATKATAIAIRSESAAKIAFALRKGLVKIQTIEPNAIIPAETAGTVSFFSSVGVTNDIQLKPNIATIGRHVFSTLPRYLGGWGEYSGTSMATPYMAGAVALYLNSVKKDKTLSTPKHVMEIFQNHALQVPVNTLNPYKKIQNPVFQGSGLLQVLDTIKKAVHISPSQISFNDTSRNNEQYKSQTVNVMNHGDQTITLHINHIPAVTYLPYGVSPANTDYQTIAPCNVTSSKTATLKFNSNVLSIPAGGSIDLTINVIPPSVNPKLRALYGGYIIFQSGSGSRVANIPYFGIAGDLTTLPIFAKGTPFLINTKTGKRLDAVDPIVMRRGKAVSMYVWNRFPSANQVFDIVESHSNRSVAVMKTVDKHYNRDISTGYPAATFDGHYIYPTLDMGNRTKVNLVNGGYRLRVRALKWNSPQNDKGQYETWTSQVIQLID